ncbi:MAG TPA: glycoside hydrolase family 127 protein [Bacteroidales bacterium]|nr:glycoside hydrolase family 127 protein [Bacteroidales bacterium]
MYNNLIANQVGDKGIRYHSVLVDHKDVNSRQPFAMSTCCEGQGTRMIGALPEFIYSVADDGIYVDLFAPSTITHRTGNGTITLKMVTQFPYDNKVELTVNTDYPIEAKIRIRIPSWAAKKMAVNVNGKTIINGNPGTYITLSRQWKNGDVISFTLPATFRTTLYEGEEKEYIGRFALEYGPVLMAYVNMKGEKDNLTLKYDRDKLLKNMKPVPGKPLHFSVAGITGFEFMPYFEVQDELFTCFL